MKTTARSAWIALSLVGLTLLPSQAKDELRVSYPSKVESSKGKEREKLFSKWMSSQAVMAHNEEMWKKGQQLVYFEFDSAQNLWRTIHSSKLQFKGPYSWRAFIDEKEMETQLNTEIKIGRQPAFIVRENGAYAMLFVSPEDMDAVRTELKELGVGEPKLKK
ncbi:MAG: hypothetical protein J0L73_23635 [Verrucomicrobia bacterium]|nr:hypothetical protein [Verrucomicrobiota bacterium]